MRTKIVDTMSNQNYEGINLPLIAVGTLISTKYFAARRVTDVHLYIDSITNEVRQTLICGVIGAH